MARGKKFIEARAKVDPTQRYPLEEAVKLVKEVSYSKFVGSVELHVKTAANPKYNDQMIRGTVVLPHGTGKTVKVAAFVSDDKKDAIKKAGADIVGNEDLLNSIQEGNIDFDILVTTPDMMRELAKMAKVLGPKGLMPSPKAGTVSQNLEQTIDEIKKGRVELKLDKTGNIHATVGKADFTDEALIENVTLVLKHIQEAKPSGIKGKLVEKIVLSPTMGPGVPVAYQVQAK